VKIYTRTGDQGDTSLIGSRVRKDDPRVVAYGEVDELNAALGLAKAEAADAALADLLRGIQKDLFAIGARLADPASRALEARGKEPVTAGRIDELERAIDQSEADLPPLRSFILPGGNRLGASLHVARTVCRRAERCVVSLSAQTSIDPLVLVYLNRLSDLLFVLARLANHRAGCTEDPW
jgi:cob(I)alamin adenosyltransferase